MTIVIDRGLAVYYCNGNGDMNRTAIDNKTRSTKIAIARIKERDLSVKRILVVDDEPDLTLTFKVGLEECHCDGKRKFEVYTYNNPLQVLSEFKPGFYDLMLVDVYSQYYLMLQILPC